MAELDALLRRKISPRKEDPTQQEGGLDLFISHDFGAPADGQPPSTNQERAIRLKKWLETKGKWKTESSAEPLKQDRSSAAAAGGASTSAGAGAPASSGGAPAAAGPCNAPGYWDFMISYSQRNPSAGLMASRLFSKLKEVGHTVWLDVEMLDKSEAAMEEAVVNSKCVIALITEGPGPDDGTPLAAAAHALDQHRAIHCVLRCRRVLLTRAPPHPIGRDSVPVAALLLARAALGQGEQEHQAAAGGLKCATPGLEGTLDQQTIA